MPQEVNEVMKALTVVLVAGTFAYAPCQAEAQQPARETPAAYASDSPLTLAERQAAWSTHKTEYRRRLLRDGQVSADRWLDAQARTARGASSATGAAPTRGTTAPPSDTTPSARKDCKKVRWVNRATPGFGGNGMTMSRVPVCND